jgi:hypothetical protein
MTRLATRRRALVAIATAVVALALVAACGSDDTRDSDVSRWRPTESDPNSITLIVAMDDSEKIAEGVVVSQDADTVVVNVKVTRVGSDAPRAGVGQEGAVDVTLEKPLGDRKVENRDGSEVRQGTSS